MLENIKDLNCLWSLVYEINNKHFPNNELVPICGNGRLFRPKIMFVFINPTHANISSYPNWKGSRFPFVGTKSFWRVLYNAGILDDELIKEINNSKKNWSLDLAESVLKFLDSKSFYFTNIVKWTGNDATLPNSKKINLFLPILEKEIQIVKPEYILTFGIIPFKNIAKQKIKLFDYHDQVTKEGKLTFFEGKFGDFMVKIIPNYFPVGRGNPKKSAEILRLVNEL